MINPELVSVNGKNISTLNKKEIVKECKKFGVDPLALCELGAIDPRQENLCMVLHYVHTVKESAVPSGSGEKAEEDIKKEQKPSTADVSLSIFVVILFFKSVYRKFCFVWVDTFRPSQHFFSHVGTEPPLPGYYQYFFGRLMYLAQGYNTSTRVYRKCL